MGPLNDSDRIDELFALVVAAPPSKRPGLLADLQVSETPDVFAELESLLAADKGVNESPEFLSYPPLGAVFQHLRTPDDTFTYPRCMDDVAAELSILQGSVAHNVLRLNRDQLRLAFEHWLASSGKIEFVQSLAAVIPSSESDVNEVTRKTIRLLAENRLSVAAAFQSSQGRDIILELIVEIADRRLSDCLERLENDETDPQLESNDICEMDASRVLDGRFRIKRFLAEGGLGQVSIAFDSQLQRDVAVKEIRHELRDSRESRARLMREAEVTGSLENPGVVPIYARGTLQDGSPYYAMRLIDGKSLKQAIKEFHEQAKSFRTRHEFEFLLRKLIDRFFDVCQTMSYVHQQGVLHRDLKPSNIMLGNHGETLVVDWGLATETHANQSCEHDPSSFERENSKKNSGTKRSDITRRGELLGTPAFTSPEQLNGRAELDQRSDIYSLGATLYVILAGVRPFKTPADAMSKPGRKRLRRPSSHNPLVPRALEEICLKSMSWEIEDRYESCESLAEDISRWREFESVSAYREPLRTRVNRWSQRHIGAVIVGSASCLIIAAVFTVSMFFLNRANEKATLQANSYNEVTDALNNLANASVSIHDGRRYEALTLIRLAQPYLYSSVLRDWAIQAMTRVDIDSDLELDVRSLVDAESDIADLRVAFSPDQSHFAISDSMGRITVFRSSDNRRIREFHSDQRAVFYVFRFSPDGRFLAAKHSKFAPINIWDMDAPSDSQPFQTKDNVSYAAFDFSPCLDKFIVGRQGSLDIYSLSEKKVQRQIAYAYEPKTINYSPEGDRVAISAADPNMVHVSNLTTAPSVLVNFPHATTVLDTAWHPNGTQLASTTQGRDIYLWNLRERQLVRMVTVDSTPRHISFNHQGDTFVTKHYDGTIRLWDVATGEFLAGEAGVNEHGRGRAPDTLKFSEDGTSLTHSHTGGTLKTWKIACSVSSEIAGSVGSILPVGIQFHKPTGMVVTASDDGVRFWDVDRRLECLRLPLPKPTSIALNRDGTSLLVCTSEGLVRVPISWSTHENNVNIDIGEPALLYEAPYLSSVETSPDGLVYYVVRQGSDGGVFEVSVATGDVKQIASAPNATHLTLHPTNGLFAYSSRDEQPIKIWDSRRQELVQQIPNHPFSEPRFSPDGKLLAICDPESLSVYDCLNWSRLYRLPRNSEPNKSLGGFTFSADSKVIAVAIDAESIQLIDAKSGTAIASLRNASNRTIASCCFDDDADLLYVQAASRNQLEIWNLSALRVGLQELGLAEGFDVGNGASTGSQNETPTISLTGPAIPLGHREREQSTRIAIEQQDFALAEELLKQSARADAGDVDTWSKLLVILARNENDAKFLQTRADVLTRFEELVDPTDITTLLISCLMAPVYPDVEKPFEQLVTCAMARRTLDLEPMQLQLLLSLRALRQKEYVVARNRCATILTTPPAKNSCLHLTAEILNWLVDAREELSPRDEESLQGFRRKLDELPPTIPWRQRMVAETLLNEAMALDSAAEKSALSSR